LQEFVDAWNRKCDELPHSGNNLGDSIIEFVMRFVAYTACANALKEEENRKIKEHNANQKDSNKKLNPIRDNHANTDLVSSRLVNAISDETFSMLLHNANELSNVLTQHNLSVKNARKIRNILNQPNQKKGFIDTLLKVIYSIRCNLFHGEKQSLPIQADVLHLTAQCLAEITPLVLDQIRREENMILDDFINELLNQNLEQE